MSLRTAATQRLDWKMRIENDRGGRGRRRRDTVNRARRALEVAVRPEFAESH